MASTFICKVPRAGGIMRSAQGQRGPGRLPPEPARSATITTKADVLALMVVRAQARQAYPLRGGRAGAHACC